MKAVNRNRPDDFPAKIGSRRAARAKIKGSPTHSFPAAYPYRPKAQRSWKKHRATQWAPRR
jgi:hypothetical protein